MDGFKKIEFTQPIEKRSLADQKNESFTMTKRKKSNFRFKLSRKGVIALAIVVVLFVLAGIPAFATYKSGMKTLAQAKLLSAALKNQDITLASEQITKTKKELQETQRNFHFLIPFKFVPVISWYYNDADHLMEAGNHGLDTAATAIDALKPYVDVLGLKGEGTFTGGSAEDRIRTAVLAASKITPEIDKIGESLVLVEKEMDQVNPDHYPTFIFGKKIQTQLVAVKEATNAFTAGITEAKPLIKALPALLGEKEEKRYLIIFQNDKELRPTGGFMTAYAIFRVDKGVIHIDRSDDIYNLDNSISGKPKPPAFLQQYLKVSALNLRDSNISPDFVESMKTFKSMYDRAGQSVEIDGIIALDTYVLVDTIKILDDQVTAGGITFTTKNDPRCDCPQVIYELEDNVSRPVNYVKEARKSLLGDLLSTILSKALSSSPKIYWGPLFQALIKGAGEKHVLFYLYDTSAQQGIESLNAAGRIKSFDGDYLHINEANLSGAKVNLFMEEKVDNSYEFKGNEIIKTVTIHYKNPHPPSDCNLERGGLCLNAEYRDWIRVYVPQGSSLIESRGATSKIKSYDELGKTVFEGLMTVRPQGIATLTLVYKLPSSLSGKSPLPVLIQKQPGTNNNEYKMMINGRTKESFELLTDKETTIKK
jgi:hypothetical protein